MPVLKLASGDLHYQLDGAAGQPVLVLSNVLGTDLDMWDAQIPAFSESFRVLRYDSRGHGRSTVSPGPYSIEQLGRDVLALLDALGIAKASFCGLSMGGLVGQWLGINAGERLHGLVLCSTAAKIADDGMWNERIEVVRKGQRQAMRDLRDAAVARWFTPGFVAARPGRVEAVVDMLAQASPEGYAACCAAVRDADFRERLGDISVPTLIVCGSCDAVATSEHGRFMQAHIPGAERIELQAAHLSNIEAAETFTRAVLDFLDERRLGNWAERSPC